MYHFQNLVFFKKMHFTLFDFAISLLKNKNEPAVKRIFLLSQERAFF